MNTKEEIKAAAAKRFKTKEVVIDGGVKVTMRELSTAEDDALLKRLFQTDESGQFKLNEQGNKIPREGARFVEEQLAATMIPVYTVEELLDPSWPESLKAELYKESLSINTVSYEDAAGNS